MSCCSSCKKHKPCKGKKARRNPITRAEEAKILRAARNLVRIGGKKPSGDRELQLYAEGMLYAASLAGGAKRWVYRRPTLKRTLFIHPRLTKKRKNPLTRREAARALSVARKHFGMMRLHPKNSGGRALHYGVGRGMRDVVRMFIDRRKR